jgi:hypothetical protein
MGISSPRPLTPRQKPSITLSNLFKFSEPLLWLPRMIRKKGISLLYRSSASRHWDWRHVYELINNRQPSNRYQPSEINPTEHSLNQNGFFRVD